MGLLDFIEQHHGVGPAAHRFGELAAFVEAHIARRRTDQLADRMALHVFRHVEADHRLFAAEEVGGQGLGELGFANAGGTGEDEAGNRPVGIFETNPGPADRLGHGLNRLVLADQALVEGFLHIQQLHRFAFGEFLHRHPGPGGHDLGDVLLGHHGGALAAGVIDRLALGEGAGWDRLSLGRSFTRVTGAAGLFVAAGLQDRADLLAQFHFLIAQFACLAKVLLAHGRFLALLHIAQLLIHFLSRHWQLGIEQSHAATGLINQVDGLIGQETIGDIAIAQGGRSHHRFVADLEAVVLLVALSQAPQDFNRVGHGGLAHHHRLEAPL